MRALLLLFCVTLLAGCGSKSPSAEESKVVTHIGQITTRQEATGDEVRDSGLNTSIYVSASSGGNISIGIGFLLSKMLSGGSDKPPMRYQVELLDGGSMTIFHDSRDFEVGDCVAISVYPEKQEEAPRMRRSEGSCQAG